MYGRKNGTEKGTIGSGMMECGTGKHLDPKTRTTEVRKAPDTKRKSGFQTTLDFFEIVLFRDGLDVNRRPEFSMGG